MTVMHSTLSSTVTTGSIAGCVTSSSSSSSQSAINSISNIVLLTSSMNSMLSSNKKRQRRVSLTEKDNIINMLRTLHPTDYATAAFKANGFKDIDTITKQSLTRFNKVPTQEMLDAYGTEILIAVRTNNLSKARQLYKEGKFNCNACNRFGESILHIACRRGNFEMVQFLIDDVGLKVDEIRDDYHRTPLHDAFWTTTASYDVVDLLLKQPHVPELLLLKDIRGYTPLDYARSEHRGNWLRFLWERRSILRPTSTSKSKDIDTAIDTINNSNNNEQHSQLQRL
jgi:ankyrin repeat protein